MQYDFGRGFGRVSTFRIEFPLNDVITLNVILLHCRGGCLILISPQSHVRKVLAGFHRVLQYSFLFLLTADQQRMLLPGPLRRTV